MRLICTIILLLTSIVLNAQKPVVGKSYIRYDGSQGTEKRSNYYRITVENENGTFYVEEFYRYTKPHQLRKTYTVNISGEKEGAYVRYNRYGVLLHKGNYSLDKRVGEWLFYIDDELHHSTPYVLGKKNGIARYYEDQKELYSLNWKNDKNHGFNKQLFKGGAIKFEGNYIEGKKEGEIVTYHKKGGVIKKEVFLNGKLEGPFESFYESAATKGIGQYLKGKEVGTWKWYREDKTIASLEQYDEEGNLKELYFFNKKGKKETQSTENVFEGLIADKENLNKFIKKFIRTNYSFPKEMSSLGFESRVIVDFIFNREGLPERIKIKSDGPIIFEKLTKEIISNIPKQKPGRVHNLDFNIKYSIPVTYRL